MSSNNKSMTTAAKRERLAYQYARALRLADYNAIERILANAETDPELQRILWSVSEYSGDALLNGEESAEEWVQDIATVMETARVHFGSENVHPSRITAEEATKNTKSRQEGKSSVPAATIVDMADEDFIPPVVTVAEVISRLAGGQTREKTESKWISHLRDNETPIGGDVSERAMTTLLACLNVAVDRANRSFIQAFHRTAAVLSMTRQQETIRFAAAREQRRRAAKEVLEVKLKAEDDNARGQ